MVANRFVEQLKMAVARAQAQWTGLDWDTNGPTVEGLESKLEALYEAKDERTRQRAEDALYRYCDGSEYPEQPVLDLADRLLRKARAYADKVKEDTEAAAESSDEAVTLATELLTLPRLRGESSEDRWSPVYDAIDAACRRERSYGDTPVWGPVLDLVAEFMDGLTDRRYDCEAAIADRV